MPKIRVNMDKLRSFSTVPRGEYVCRLTQVEESESRAGNAMLVWDWTVDRGTHQGATIRTWTVTEGDNQGSLKDHLMALGLKGKVSLDTDRLLGKRALLSVAVGSREVNGEVREFNNLLSIRPVPTDAKDEDDFGDDDMDDEELDDDEIPF